MSLSHFQLTIDPVPAPDAVVTLPHVRFTILTSRLIRMESSPTAEFEDHASQAFWYRHQPTPPFQQRQVDGAVEIETEHLLLRYVPSERVFTPVSLSVYVKSTHNTWHFGEHIWKSGDLKGTTRTLDETDGFANLESGLMARSGWAVYDDSRSLVFDEQGWLTARTAPGNLDLYFFGYGHDYVGCLQDFQKVAGSTPMVPRWVLGNWWSRYWAYTQAELQNLMEDFEAHQIPLSVCIVDMDWHIVQTGNQSVGWTGYTWNRDLFPDPQAFIDWLHARGLRTALNLHPADGVFPHEAQYEDMATAVGIDPASEEPVPFDIANRVFADAYFKHLHHPFELAGVDFWWLDWQQGTQSKMRGLDPLYWLNHLHFYDLGRDGAKRPFIFSRWGGLGNHRYPIGFSGDTVVSWKSLAFLPYFTATAANVGYGWWSHDIGGHMWGVEEGELYARWVQYGVFSPVLRLHSSNNPYSERRPWAWGLDIEHVSREAMQLRHALIPYIYTMAWRNASEGIPLITPLYWSHPEIEDAYNCPQVYWFGTELIAAPFVAPAQSDVGLSRQRVWLPEGEWRDFFTGEAYAGGWTTVFGDLNAIPIFAKVGAIVPLGPMVGWGGVDNPASLQLHLFAGADGKFELYEDDGDTIAYQSGSYALTPFELTWQERELKLTIGPANGDLSGLPMQRTYEAVIHGVVEPAQIELTINGAVALPEVVRYDAERETISVVLGALDPMGTSELTLSNGDEALASRRDRRAEKVRTMLRSFKVDNQVKARIDAELPQLMAGEINLSRYALTGAQSEALAQVLGQA